MCMCGEFVKLLQIRKSFHGIYVKASSDYSVLWRIIPKLPSSIIVHRSLPSGLLSDIQLIKEEIVTKSFLKIRIDGNKVESLGHVWQNLTD